jgi:hypothetical protein
MSPRHVLRRNLQLFNEIFKSGVAKIATIDQFARPQPNKLKISSRKIAGMRGKITTIELKQSSLSTLP